MEYSIVIIDEIFSFFFVANVNEYEKLTLLQVG